MKILFADDDIKHELDRDWMYRELLAAMKFKGIPGSVAVARNGQETDNMLSKKKYEGIILDIQMEAGKTPPQFLDGIPRYKIGLEILKKFIRGEYKNSPKTPIIVLTGTAVAEDLGELNVIEAEKKLLVKVCMKPSEMEDVFDELCELRKSLLK
jgi:CheY-like chemotaxis protein